jgi:Amt family ammonium transporter
MMDDLKFSIKTVFIITSTVTIFQMQLGISMFECGQVNPQSTSNILVKNVSDLFISAIAFYFIGFSFMNRAQGGFIGSASYLLSTSLTNDEILHWLYQFSFCSTAGTIVSGSLAERINLDSYLVFSFIMAAFIYPVAASWCWGNGWL